MKDLVSEPLEKVVEHLEEEARMVLPGIQALFGFQLIAVFNNRFKELTENCQFLHFFALLCTAISVVFVLTPAAYHRQAEPAKISSKFCKIGSFYLTISLFPLALGSSLDLYVISKLIIKSENISRVTAVAAFLFFVIFWFVYPQASKRAGLK